MATVVTSETNPIPIIGFKVQLDTVQWQDGATKNLIRPLLHCTIMVPGFDLTDQFA